MLRRFIFLVVLSCCGVLRAETITVSAAVSMKEALSPAAMEYLAETKDHVRLNFGPSATLQSQIEQGSEVDLFISAGPHQVDALVTDGLADPTTQTVLATNSLVLVVPSGSENPPTKFEDLADERFAHIAIVDPKNLLLGMYSIQTFGALHLDNLLAPRLSIGESARQVLSYVSRGEVEAGVVYATDAADAGKGVTVAAVAPDNCHDPIVYIAVVIKNDKSDAAGRFLKFLQSDKARGIFKAHGFGVATPATRPG